MPVTLAVITAEPGAIPVTGTATLVAPAASFTVAVTVALLGSLELRLIAAPPGGTTPAVTFSVRFPETPGLMVRGLPEKLIFRRTGTPITAVCGGILSA